MTLEEEAVYNTFLTFERDTEWFRELSPSEERALRKTLIALYRHGRRDQWIEDAPFLKRRPVK